MRFVYYLIFVFIGAPIEIQLDFWSGTLNDRPDLMYRPLAQGLLFTYAVVLAAETVFRLAFHREAFEHKRQLNLLVGAVFLILCLFIFDYLLALRPQIEHGVDVTASWAMQLVVLAIGLTASFFSYHAIERSRKSATI